MGEGTNFSYKISHGNVMYSMMTIVKNTVLYIWKLLRRVDFKSSHHKKKKSVTMYRDGY